MVKKGGIFSKGARLGVALDTLVRTEANGLIKVASAVAQYQATNVIPNVGEKLQSAYDESGFLGLVKETAKIGGSVGGAVAVYKALDALFGYVGNRLGEGKKDD